MYCERICCNSTIVIFLRGISVSISARPIDDSCENERPSLSRSIPSSCHRQACLLHTLQMGLHGFAFSRRFTKSYYEIEKKGMRARFSACDLMLANADILSLWAVWILRSHWYTKTRQMCFWLRNYSFSLFFDWQVYGLVSLSLVCDLSSLRPKWMGRGSTA